MITLTGMESFRAARGKRREYLSDLVVAKSDKVPPVTRYQAMVPKTLARRVIFGMDSLFFNPDTRRVSGTPYSCSYTVSADWLDLAAGADDEKGAVALILSTAGPADRLLLAALLEDRNVTFSVMDPGTPGSLGTADERTVMWRKV